jgi:type I pullulanase
MNLDMGIAVPARGDGPLRWTATDRSGGFITLGTREDLSDSGYWRGEARLFIDAWLVDSGGRRLGRDSALEVRVEAEGLISRHAAPGRPAGGVGLGIHPLLGRAAIGFSLPDGLPKGWSLAIALPLVPVIRLDDAGHAGEGQSLAGCPAFRLGPEALGQWASLGGTGTWAAGTTVEVHCDAEGKTSQRTLIVMNKGEQAPRLSVCLAFGKDAGSAAGLARDLVDSAALEAHRAEVERLLSGPSIRTADGDFDRALAWASYSGRLLVTREGGLGIWAGLPWFRDNWGRDTFIALSGILLVRGLWDEAREVLSGFAALQDLDPSSPTFGRIPNRFRGPDDVIYNTVDGSLWFVRALLEYGEASGDLDFVLGLRNAVYGILDAELGRCDGEGFLLHADADTWMDARIDGRLPWSARGDRAVEVQGLWYAALHSGARLARLASENARQRRYSRDAARLHGSFRLRFHDPDSGQLADRLLPDTEGCDDGRAAEGGPWAGGPDGRGRRDQRVRPNQLLALFAALPVAEAGGEGLLDAATMAGVVASAVPELVYPWGVATLSQEDPFFHATHEGPGLYHKDAAYHNGTVWDWLMGPVSSLLCAVHRQDLAGTLVKEASKRILKSGAAGSLAECGHALPDARGRFIQSGTYSQAWSVSEFCRTVYRDLLGFRPHLLEGRVTIAPRLPPGWAGVTASLPLGSGASLELRIEGGEDLPGQVPPPGDKPVDLSMKIIVKSIGEDGGGGPGRDLSLDFDLSGTDRDFGSSLGLMTGETAELVFYTASGRLFARVGGGAQRELVCAMLRMHDPRASAICLALPRRRPWCRAAFERDWLRRIVEGRNYDAGPRVWLEDWYSAPSFERCYGDSRPFGAFPGKRSSLFRLWAPLASEAELLLFADGLEGPEIGRHAFLPDGRGSWSLRLPGNLHGSYYRFRLRVFGRMRGIPDPWARSAGTNGFRSMVVDFEQVEPPGWRNFKAPALASSNDAVIWEAHIRDLSSGPGWGGPEVLRGSYAGAALSGSSCSGGGAAKAVPSGLDHAVSLGITHIQVLPVSDFVSVDEGRARDPEYARSHRRAVFNWGYDPAGWFLPEGSYASDGADGEVRVRELRSLVQAYGRHDIGVIMDVVYNHVPDAEASALDAGAPGYFFRPLSFSGAGDDVASERSMVRRLIAASLELWLRDYKVAGFRFDLMGLLDVKTMLKIRRRLRRIKRDVLLYGEGWDMYRGASMTAASQREIGRLPGIGMFNDAARDGIKGSVFDAKARGFIHDGSRIMDLRLGIVGAVSHPGVDNARVEGSANKGPWSGRTASSLAYAELHDNLTLADKNRLALPDLGETEYVQLQRLGLGLVLLSQGIPFLHAGGEFLRSKAIPAEWIQEAGRGGGPLPPDLSWSQDGKHAYSHNSYDLSDEVNALDWREAARRRELVAFVAGLVALRRAHPLFRIRKGREVRKRLAFLPSVAGLEAWTLRGGMRGEAWAEALVAASAHGATPVFRLPPRGPWYAVVDGGQVFDPDSAGGYAALRCLEGGSECELGSCSLLVLARPVFRS